jgi:dihydrolipoamide dehydrogenase
MYPIGLVMKVIDTDVAIIGAGTAGMSAYRTVKAAGLRAVLIEGGPYGTMCARVGCMPSKLLIAAAEAAHAAKHTEAFGVRVQGTVQVDGRAVMERVRSERDRFVGFVVNSVEGFPPEDRLRGYAQFVSDTELQVGNETRVRCSRVVIATGSTPFVPEQYKALGDRVVVNDDVFDWTDLPRRVLVVGPAVIGLELGQALARLGVAVTIVGRHQGLAGIADPAVLNSALSIFNKNAEFELLTCANVTKLERGNDGVTVTIETASGKHTRVVDYVLVATGRRPNLQALNLSATSVALNEAGLPDINANTLQVGNMPWFIAGDVNGLHPLLHEAADDGRFAAENAVRYPDIQTFERRAPMSVVFTDPQIMRVGPRFDTFDQSDTVVGTIDFSDQGRSRVMLKNRGVLRVYASRGSRRFLGAEMVGPSAEHLAHLLAWSLQQNLTIAQMLAMPFYHPVIEEGLRTALREAQALLGQ